MRTSFGVLVVLFSITGYCATVCVPADNSTSNLGEYAPFVKYDYSYTDDAQLLSARSANAAQRTSNKYMVSKFIPSLIASTLYPKCDMATGAIYPDVCINDVQYVYCCNGGASLVGTLPQVRPPVCTPIYYQGRTVYSYYNPNNAACLQLSLGAMLTMLAIALF